MHDDKYVACQAESLSEPSMLTDSPLRNFCATYLVMAYIVMTSIVMACVVMA